MADEKDVESRFLEMLSFDKAAQDPSRREVSSTHPDESEIREYILDQAFDFTHWAVDGKQVLIKSPHGRVLLEVLDGVGSEYVEITYVPDLIRKYEFFRQLGRNGVSVFRMPRSHLASLSEKLRSRPEYRVPFSRDL